MAFNIFTPLFDQIDQATLIFVTDVMSKSITMLTPVLIIGLTVSFILHGLLILRGGIEMPIMDFFGRYLRFALILSIMCSGGFYQRQLAQMIQTLPDDIALALLADPAQGKSAAALIDQSAAKGFHQASKAFGLCGFFKTNGLAYAFFGVIIFITTGILVLIGGGYLLLAKLILSLLVGLGPFFIAALLFQPTHRFFEMWVAQLVNYLLLIVLFAAVFGLMMDIFGSYIDDVHFDGLENTGYSLGGAIILSGAMIIILRQLPSIASSLAGGVSLSYFQELAALKRGAASTFRGAKIAGNAAATGAKKTMGYFRGRQANSTQESASFAQSKAVGQANAKGVKKNVKSRQDHALKTSHRQKPRASFEQKATNLLQRVKTSSQGVTTGIRRTFGSFKDRHLKSSSPKSRPSS